MKVYICIITEDITGDRQGTILKVTKNYKMARSVCNKFNDKYIDMIADVNEYEMEE